MYYVAVLMSHYIYVLHFMHLSYLCILSCSSRPAIVLYCLVGRETLCCLCLNKLLCIVLLFVGFDSHYVISVHVCELRECQKAYNRISFK